MSSPSNSESKKYVPTIRSSWLKEKVRYSKEAKSNFIALRNRFQSEIVNCLPGLKCIDGGSMRKHTFVQSDEPDTDTVVIFPFTYDLNSDIADWCTAQDWTLSYPQNFSRTSQEVAEIFASSRSELKLDYTDRLYPFHVLSILKMVLEAVLRDNKKSFERCFGSQVTVTEIRIKKRCFTFSVGELAFDFVPAVRVSYENDLVDGVLVPYCINEKAPFAGFSSYWRLNFPRFNLKAINYLTAQYDLEILHVLQLLKYLNGVHEWGISSYALECLIVMKEAETPWAFQFYYPNSKADSDKVSTDFNRQFWFIFRLLQSAIDKGKLPHQHSTIENFIETKQRSHILTKLKSFVHSCHTCTSENQFKRFLLENKFFACSSCNTALDRVELFECLFCPIMLFCARCHVPHLHLHNNFMFRYS